MSRTTKRFVMAAAVLGLAFGSSTRGRADLIDVQFNESSSPAYSGGAVLGSSGDTWNAFGNTQIPSAGGGPLALSNNTASGLTLSYSTPDYFYNAGPYSLFHGTAYQNLMESFLTADLNGTDGAGTVSLTGLTPGGEYELVLYSASDTSGRVTDFNVTGQTTQSQSVTANTPADFSTPGTNYAEFTVVANFSGEISISMTAGDGKEADLNGLQLESMAATPEPSTFLIASVGTIFGLAVAWRRRARAGRTPA